MYAVLWQRKKNETENTTPKARDRETEILLYEKKHPAGRNFDHRAIKGTLSGAGSGSLLLSFDLFLLKQTIICIHCDVKRV